MQPGGGVGEGKSPRPSAYGISAAQARAVLITYLSGPKEAPDGFTLASIGGEICADFFFMPTQTHDGNRLIERIRFPGSVNPQGYRGMIGEGTGSCEQSFTLFPSVEAICAQIGTFPPTDHGKSTTLRIRRPRSAGSEYLRSLLLVPPID